jgi:hypothetical protein
MTTGSDVMAHKYAPFTITVTYTGKKSKELIHEAYHDFYIQVVKQKLTDSNISDIKKKEIIDRLIDYHSKNI